MVLMGGYGVAEAETVTQGIIPTVLILVGAVPLVWGAKVMVEQVRREGVLGDRARLWLDRLKGGE